MITEQIGVMLMAFCKEKKNILTNRLTYSLYAEVFFMVLFETIVSQVIMEKCFNFKVASIGTQ